MLLHLARHLSDYATNRDLPLRVRVFPFCCHSLGFCNLSSSHLCFRVSQVTFVPAKRKPHIRSNNVLGTTATAAQIEQS